MKKAIQEFFFLRSSNTHITGKEKERRSENKNLFF